MSRLINELWMTSGLWKRASFLRATKDVRATQSNYLRKLIDRNRDSDFGRMHNFSRLGDAQAFQQSVPAQSYEELVPWIEAITSGRSCVLTTEPVRLLQPTSGTSAGRKLIPFTESLAQEFQRAVDVWTCDLMLCHPRARRGKSYWSISPAVTNFAGLFGDEATIRSAVPIGFASDLSYVGFVQRQMARQLMAVPVELGRCSDLEEWRFWTLLHLLRARDLSLISVWSPTFLLELMNQLQRLAPSLLKSLAASTRDPITGRVLRGDALLASRIEKILSEHTHALQAMTSLWPQLALVSCWADASSAVMAEHLQQHLAGVDLQPKGLMATEACITFPLSGHGNVLAIQSHFFEFATVESPQTLYLAHELVRGQAYEVLVTTGGGLYRYRMHDIVEVTGFVHKCPTLRFVGRNNQTCDMVGEKLAERFVRGCLNEALQSVDAQEVLSMLVPSRSELVRHLTQQPLNSGPVKRGYYLVVSGPMTHEKLSKLPELVERRLLENDYYRHARLHEQLQPIQVVHLPQPGDLVNAYTQYCLSRKLRLADIKLSSLCTL